MEGFGDVCGTLSNISKSHPRKRAALAKACNSACSSNVKTTVRDLIEVATETQCLEL